MAGIAQLGERQTEDLKVACSIHAHRKIVLFIPFVNGLGFLKLWRPNKTIHNFRPILEAADRQKDPRPVLTRFSHFSSSPSVSLFLIS